MCWQIGTGYHRRTCYPLSPPPPRGLSHERQVYLHDTIREYCPHEVRDRVCARPLPPDTTTHNLPLQVKNSAMEFSNQHSSTHTCTRRDKSRTRTHLHANAHMYSHGTHQRTNFEAHTTSYSNIYVLTRHTQTLKHTQRLIRYLVAWDRQ